MIDTTGLAWQEHALCHQTDPEAFFPEKGGTTRAALRVCESCPVTRQCLDYALTNREEYGVWGGTSREHRRRLTRKAHS